MSLMDVRYVSDTWTMFVGCDTRSEVRMKQYKPVMETLATVACLLVSGEVREVVHAEGEEHLFHCDFCVLFIGRFELSVDLQSVGELDFQLSKDRCCCRLLYDKCALKEIKETVAVNRLCRCLVFCLHCSDVDIIYSFMPYSMRLISLN
jgi:hypothetical protein